MKQTNIAVIGAGSISEAHLKAYDRNSDAKLYAICDLNVERANAAARKYGIANIYTDYRELLADPSIEAVSICTWNNKHAEMAIAAIEAGKHVLVEKPLCRTVEEALQIQRAVRSSNKILQIGYVRRFEPKAQMLRKFVDEGEFGDIYFAKTSYIRRLGNPGGWFADIERSGGGPLIDIGVHVIDIIWYLMGKPKVKSVSGNTYRQLGNRANVENLSFYKAADYDAGKNTVEDMANVMIRFENGASLLVDVSFTLHAKDESSIRCFGQRGGFEIEPELVLVTEKHNTILNMQPQTDSPGFQFDTAFQNEIDHFIDCVRQGKEPISPVEDGVEMMKILCGIYESAAKGVEILL
ncbi:Gfo/Idh/MocA family protein [Paenibacillus nasutitermitis]|uniref:Oxidoreductase n=1 Tax=Paenibacillus nasutitermitis TaxID=1652958 RepID=A0A916YKK8_9BACL|nr:Gfo/Idh/MocA family oxidoreductase [Paenibacillus nasutitermitis]GGD49745.1 oxidoreductase [Paenibacillus nasutitermitis]